MVAMTCHAKSFYTLATNHNTIATQMRSKRAVHPSRCAVLYLSSPMNGHRTHLAEVQNVKEDIIFSYC